MIPSLHISGFKLFRDIDLPKLGSLNLFVGKNNTGKSCLLEAVELYASSSPWEILRIASRREPDAVASLKFPMFHPNELEQLLRPIMDLFHREHGHIFNPKIRLSAGDGHLESDFVLKCDPMLAHIHEHEAMISEGGEKEASRRRRYPGHFLGDGFEVLRGKKKSGPIFHEFLVRMDRYPMPEEMMDGDGWKHPHAAPVAFLPSRGFPNSEAKRLFDRASLADKDELLLQWLRLVEPEVKDLRYISDSVSEGDFPYLKINGDMGRVPLASMGDGMTRLFHIGLAMANASGGILLIDEFENGLHWEAQEQLWKALFQAAKQFGVQVFATTHSTDCIRGFLAAQGEELGLTQNYVYRLERNGKDVDALELPVDNLDAALRQQVEVR